MPDDVVPRDVVLWGYFGGRWRVGLDGLGGLFLSTSDGASCKVLMVSSECCYGSLQQPIQKPLLDGARQDSQSVPRAFGWMEASQHSIASVRCTIKADV